MGSEQRDGNPPGPPDVEARRMDERAERYRALFDATWAPLQAYARRRTGPDEADDVVAEVLTVAWRRLDDLPEGLELPWLYGVARRTLANHRRATGRRLRLVERVGRSRAADSDVDGVAVPDHGDEGEAVLVALSQLRRDDRELLRLAAWEDLRPAEIAVALGCSENAAALRLSRARRRLRAALTGIEGIRTPTVRKAADG